MPRHGTRLPLKTQLSVRNRDGNKCRLCWSTFRLHVHHLDEHGQNHVSPNHDPDNLVTLCRPCHQRVHSEDMRLTPEIIARADRVRLGEEVLLARPVEDEHDIQLIGNSIPRFRYTVMRPEEAYFENHPDEDCQPGCPCGTEDIEFGRPYTRKFPSLSRSHHY